MLRGGESKLSLHEETRMSVIQSKQSGIGVRGEVGKLNLLVFRPYFHEMSALLGFPRGLLSSPYLLQENTSESGKDLQSLWTYLCLNALQHSSPPGAHLDTQPSFQPC